MSDLINAVATFLENSPEYLIVGAVFLAAVLLVVGIASLTESKPLARRLEAQHEEMAEAVTTGQGPRRRRKKSIWGAFVTRRFGGAERLILEGGDNHSQIRQTLIHAGYFHPIAPRIYYFSRIILAILLPVAFWVTSSALLRLPASSVFLLAILLGIVGLYMPLSWILMRARRRQTAARRSFPDALDLILVCVEAGLSLDAAIQRVAEEIEFAHPILGEHLAMMSLELNAGQSRELALRHLAQRIGIDEAHALATLLVQSEKLGTSIAQTLRVHADDIRQKRMLTAEEKANMLPVKLAFPLVGFILPALFVAIMTPAVISVIRVLLPTMGR